MKGKEIWKDILGYEGKYMVSNWGRVKSLNYNKTGKEGILKAVKVGNGYLQVHLCKDGKGKWYFVHRLVASAFLENPEGYTEVNHINEDKADCRAENLEWCSRSYNCSYNGRAKKIGEKNRGRKQSEETIKKRAEKLSKPVIGINKVSGLKLEFPSISEAKRCTNISQSHICACCKGKRNSAGGYVWYYAD